jgi:hypothetical protein
MAKSGYLLRTSSFLGVQPHGDHAGRREFAWWALVSSGKKTPRTGE